MRRLRRRFNEKLRSLRDVEKHIMKNIDRDYKDLAKIIIDEVGIYDVVEGYITGIYDIVDINYRYAKIICEKHSNIIVDVWREANRNNIPKRIDTYNDLIINIARNLYNRATDEMYLTLEEFNKEMLDKLLYGLID